MLEQQITRFTKLLGVDMLNESAQDTIKTILKDLITENGEPIPKIGQLMHELGADKLSEDIQKDLIEKICISVVAIRENLAIPKDVVMKIKDFKWDSTAPAIINETKIEKSNYIWPNTELDTKIKQVKKDDYPWRNKEKAHLL
jgi:hypothetical protein